MATTGRGGEGLLACLSDRNGAKGIRIFSADLNLVNLTGNPGHPSLSHDPLLRCISASTKKWQVSGAVRRSAIKTSSLRRMSGSLF